MAFDEAVEHTLEREGVFSDDPADLGGATKYGITEATARAYGYEGPMQGLPKAVAVRIYKSQYWDALRLDDVAAVSEALAEKLFDMAVNVGVGRAAKWLQCGLNVLNREEALYADLSVDGDVEAITLGALQALEHVRGARGMTVLYRIMNGLQVAHYVTISEQRPTNERFTFGWVLRRTT